MGYFVGLNESVEIQMVFVVLGTGQDTLGIGGIVLGGIISNSIHDIVGSVRCIQDGGLGSGNDFHDIVLGLIIRGFARQNESTPKGFLVLFFKILRMRQKT